MKRTSECDEGVRTRYARDATRLSIYNTHLSNFGPVHTQSQSVHAEAFPSWHGVPTGTPEPRTQDALKVNARVATAACIAIG